MNPFVQLIDSMITEAEDRMARIPPFSANCPECHDTGYAVGQDGEVEPCSACDAIDKRKV